MSRASRGSFAVAAGVLASRVAGLVRQSVFAYFFGNSAAADVFAAGFRIPNLLQNLFGEGALGASLIPVYARLEEQGRAEEASRVAAVVATVLAVAMSVLVLVGVAATPWILAIVAPGFEGEKRLATIRIVRIFFPGAGLLVLSAWCLGVLNSHRRFFLSYVAPVVWSAAIVAALLVYGRSTSGYALGEAVAWGSLVGSALQLLVQLPLVLSLLGSFRPSLDLASAHVREVFRNFGPVALSRGVVQISAYVDQILASFLPSGAIAALAYAQVLYTLPVSLFGMSVSAAELPEMSRALGAPHEAHEILRRRIAAGLARIAYFVVPAAAAMLALGDVLASLLFERGKFARADAVYVWTVLAGSAVGLLATTLGRLYASAFYALGDTRAPLRFAIARVALTTLLGWLCAFPLPRLLGLDPSWGTVGLTFSAGLAGWVEFALLRRGLAQRIGAIEGHAAGLPRLWIAAALSAAASWGVKLGAGSGWLAHLAVLVSFGACYLAITSAFGVVEAKQIVAIVARRAARS